MAVLDASALDTDPDGLAFLRDVLAQKSAPAAPDAASPVAPVPPRSVRRRDGAAACATAKAGDQRRSGRLPDRPLRAKR